MVNEVLEVQRFLEGKNIYKDSHYRTCYLLAMWYKEQGLSQYETRQAIFKWANANKVHLDLSVNGVVTNAFATERKLRDETVIVRFNQHDIDEINDHFDGRTTKKVALAMLALEKVAANKDGEFDVSLVALAHWLGMTRQTLNGRYLKELEDFSYVQKVNDDDIEMSAWDKLSGQPKSRLYRYKLLVKSHNSGDIVLHDNNLSCLYNDAFGGH